MVLTRIRNYIEQLRQFHQLYRRGERCLYIVNLDRRLADLLTADDYVVLSKMLDDLVREMDFRVAQRMEGK